MRAWCEGDIQTTDEYGQARKRGTYNLLLAALERSQLSKLLCCYHMDGWDSLDLCELASKEVVFSERGAYPSPLNSKL